jgi:hypothetical protein
MATSTITSASRAGNPARLHCFFIFYILPLFALIGKNAAPPAAQQRPLSGITLSSLKAYYFHISIIAHLAKKSNKREKENMRFCRQNHTVFFIKSALAVCGKSTLFTQIVS